MTTKATTETALIKSPRGGQIEPYVFELLTTHLSPSDIHRASTPEGDIQSLTVPRTILRAQILADADFRRSFRELEVSVQDIDTRGRLGEPLLARQYVADTKAVGISAARPLPTPLRDTIRNMQEWLDSAGFVMKVGVLGLMIGLPIYVAVQTARYAATVIEEYAEATAAALESGAGLDRVLQARSGHQQRALSNSESSPANSAAANPPAVKIE